MLVFVTVGVVSAPAFAQQRIQISDLIQRIDRLETEVVRLRVSQGSGGGDVARLDLFEQELRRLTGLIERFEFESRRAETERAKRLDVMEARLEALERSNTVVSVSPPAAPSFAAEQNFSHEQMKSISQRQRRSNLKLKRFFNSLFNLNQNQRIFKAQTFSMMKVFASSMWAPLIGRALSLKI